MYALPERCQFTGLFIPNPIYSTIPHRRMKSRTSSQATRKRLPALLELPRLTSGTNTGSTIFKLQTAVGIAQ
ncbi:hypothetical protein [Serratia symbiotica]|uniref:hypothetical protein n=1 Tax=Serratia symbiotica TaxID=138074 RepID=UPI0030CCD935